MRIKDLPATTSVSGADYMIVDQGVSNPVTRRTTLASAFGQSAASEVLTAVAGTNTITGTSAQAFVDYAAGQRFQFATAGANTGAVTLNVNSRGAKAVVAVDGTALTAGALPAGTWVTVEYNGTAFTVLGYHVLRSSWGAAAVGYAPTGTVAATTVQGAIDEVVSDLAASSGSSLVGFLQSGTGAVTRTAQDKMRETVSAFDYMTTAEIAAVQSYAYAVDMTATLQNAINQAFALQADLYIPAGGYSVTGLYLPGRVSGGTDDRAKAIRIYGQGTGEPFVVTSPRGTVIKSVTNAPVLQDYLDTDPSSNGTVEIDHIRFDGTSSTPVVLLQSFYGTSSFHNNVIYQRGTGDGLKIGYSATVWVHQCYALNKDFVTYVLGAARTGVGFNYIPSYDGGLVTISKCTSRGWLTAYNIGGAGVAYSPTIRDSECSVVYNGIILNGTRKAVVSACYMEGGDQGVGVTDTGDWSTIRDTLIFPGFAKGIDATSTSTKGTLIEGNIISLGAVVNAIGVDVTSSAAFGGYNKNVISNSFTYTAGTAGVNGIKINGAEPRINVTGNMFDPRGAWTGASTAKINNTSTSGATGLITGQTGDYESAYLSNGAIALRQGSSALTESNVTANNLTVPDGVSYFSCAATVATTVQRFTAGQTSGRLVAFRTTNANMTFTDTAYNQLAGGVSFTGPGTITFLIDRIGADSYGYEIARTVF